MGRSKDQLLYTFNATTEINTWSRQDRPLQLRLSPILGSKAFIVIFTLMLICLWILAIINLVGLLELLPRSTLGQKLTMISVALIICGTALKFLDDFHAHEKSHRKCSRYLKLLQISNQMLNLAFRSIIAGPDDEYDDDGPNLELLETELHTARRFALRHKDGDCLKIIDDLVLKLEECRLKQRRMICLNSID